jgi:hypothetical protein
MTYTVNVTVKQSQVIEPTASTEVSQSTQTSDVTEPSLTF